MPPVALQEALLGRSVCQPRASFRIPRMAPSAAVNRLEELESRRMSYEALSQKLFTLPQKLRHPGLIPVGPRLYLPGELVRTNEVTVLLGSDGEHSYFAERSAFQASGIVQRRLKVIDERVKELDIGALKADDIEREIRASDARKTRLAPKKVAEGKRKAVRERKRVSFREPVVTDVHSAPPSPKPSATSSTNGRKDGRLIRAELDQAIADAQRQVLADGVVSITEVYDDDSDSISRVELPDGFEPDADVNFDNTDDLLDVTGDRDDTYATREDFLQALIDAEVEAENEEAEYEAQEAKKRLKKEEQEFGKGFAKGFFGPPGKKKQTQQAKTVNEPANREKIQRGGETPDPAETEPVGERVVERRVRRKGRKGSASTILARRNVAVIPDELLAEDENAGISKFRQMRSLQRGGSS